MAAIVAPPRAPGESEFCASQPLQERIELALCIYRSRQNELLAAQKVFRVQEAFYAHAAIFDTAAVREDYLEELHALAIVEDAYRAALTRWEALDPQVGRWLRGDVADLTACGLCRETGQP